MLFYTLALWVCCEYCLLRCCHLFLMHKTHTHHTGQSHAHTYTSLDKDADARAFTQSVIPSATFLLESLSTGSFPACSRIVAQNNQTDSLSLCLCHTHTRTHTLILVPPPWFGLMGQRTVTAQGVGERMVNVFLVHSKLKRALCDSSGLQSARLSLD